MSKKKSQKKSLPQDFTINESANAPKPVTRIKKSTVDSITTTELSWDQLSDDDLDIVEEINIDGTKNFVYKKKDNAAKTEHIDNRPGEVYPEIIWYLISHYIKPEQIGTFARINKTTYAITKRESFWRMLYVHYCEMHPRLPPRLRIEDIYRAYGLKQRVVRALYHTYDVFVKKVAQQALQDSRPHQLVKRTCSSVWFCKGTSHWSIYFKFKKPHPLRKVRDIDFIEELGRIDANPEEDCQVLQVSCQSFHPVPPLMGMTLSSLSVVLSQGFRHKKLCLGFNTGLHNVSKDILPECSVIIDTVVNIYVFDWWHPNYPHFENKLPVNVMDDESVPVLKKDFFAARDRDVV